MADQKHPSLLDMTKLRLSAPNPNPAVKGGRWATLRFDIFRNNPRIVVDTMDEALRNKDMGFGRIQHTMDPLLFNMFMEQVLRICQHEGEYKEKVEGLGHSYVNGQKSQEITPQTDLWVGKDKDGVVYISVIAKKEGFPVIKFPFGPADRRFVKYYHADGSEFTKAEISVLAARGYARLLTQVMNAELVRLYEPPQPPAGGFGGNRGGGGGGYQQRQGGGGGGGGGQQQQRAPVDTTVEDDLPF